MRVLFLTYICSREEQVQPDYEGLTKHLIAYRAEGIPIGKSTLVRLAKKYNCEVPEMIHDELIFKTI